ncbi:hypothetical protein [Nitrobacter winogradskyi]|uniref:Exo-beta-1,3-glucanase (GH17 family) n=2 Tax=Nitrobacter winogradskyi TaxID=913 RepID=A0ACC6AFS7_NITWI|nr:hypothetical protein [Nitrobacter winogradskyi]MCP1998146.1 exo-beta-1,3-glucanase (GH17 family) [Nitrobacter winogradskyi]GEC15261.1 hypothetical protein NWI01_11530 [Nitrobacter winogradskyi]
MSTAPDGWFRKLETIKAHPELISGAELITIQNLAYWRGAPKAKDVELVDALYERCREMAQ